MLKGKIRKERVFWTLDEEIQISRKMAELRLADITQTPRALILEAQKVLPEERRRAISIVPKGIINRCQSNVDGWGKERANLTPVVVERPVEAPVEEVVAKMSTRELLKYAILRIVDLLPLDEQPKTVIQVPRGMAKYEKEAEIQRPLLRRILVVGLIAEQEHIVKSKCCLLPVDLTFVKVSKKVRELPTSMDYCIVFKMCSHKWFNRVIAKYNTAQVFYMGSAGLKGVINKIAELAKT